MKKQLYFALAAILSMGAAPPAAAYTTTPTPPPGQGNGTGDGTGNGNTTGSGQESSGQLGFSASLYNASEDSGQVIITVTRSGGASGAVTVNFTTRDGTATAGEDYNTASGTLNWAAGQSGAQSFTVVLLNDTKIEDDETVLLDLSNPGGGAAAGVFQAVLTINSEDHRSTVDILTSVAQNPTQYAIAETIAEVYDKGTASAELMNLFDELVQNAEKNPQAVADALQAIAPEEYLSQGRLSLETGAVQVRNITSRLYALRRGRRCIDVSGVNAELNDKILSGSAFFTPDDLCPEENNNPAAKKIGVFMEGNFSTGERDVSARESGFDFDTHGITAGVDYRLSNSAIIGAAFGWMKTEADLARNSGVIEADGYSVSLYGTLYESEKFYLDSIYSYGTNSFDNQRHINYRVADRNVAQNAVSSNDSTVHSLSLGMGHHYRYGSLLHTPNMNLDYARINLDGLNENLDKGGSGGALGMSVEEQEVESLRMRLGWNIAYEVKHSWGHMLPQLSLHGVYDFKNDERYLNGHFLEDASRTRFFIRNDKPDRAYMTLGLGFLADFAHGRQIYLNYETVLENKDTDYQAINAGLRLPF